MFIIQTNWAAASKPRRGMLRQDQRNTLTVPLVKGEFWWSGVVDEGYKMPLSSGTYSFDLATHTSGNQTSPLLLSSKGRYVWSEGPFKFAFEEGKLLIDKGPSAIVRGRCGTTLKEAYRYVSKTFFPPSGKSPDTLMFTRPQFNTWIELVYNQNQKDILAYARAIIANGYQPGVLMIDDNWQRYYGNFDFKAERFPDPKNMVADLHRLGFKVMLWVCPFISADSFEFRQLLQQGYLLKRPEDGTYRWQKENAYIINWWNGYSGMLDLTNPKAAAWFTERLNYLQREYQIDGFKFDAGDIEFYPKDAVVHHEVTANEQIRAYALLGKNFPLNEFRVTWKVGGQPVAQRLKDKNHNWADLQKLIPNSFIESLSGNYFTCPDLIGGGEFKSFINLGKYDEELIVRSAQCQALMPMMQFSVAPWRILSARNQNAVLTCTYIRSKFKDYILSLVNKAASTGEPIVTPLAYYYPHGFETIRDEFMLGEHVLVAPMVTPGTSRSVILPPGRWQDDQGKVYGAGIYHFEVPIERLLYFEKVNVLK